MNGTFFGSITKGAFRTDLTERACTIIELFKSAGFKSNVVMDFRSWLMGHFTLNAAMHLETLKYDTSKNLIGGFQTTKYWRNVIANGKKLLSLLKVRNFDSYN